MSPPRRRASAVAFVLVLPSACADLDYRPGDWEIDVVAALPPDAETLRICIEGAGITTVGAGNGRAAVRGLPPEPTEVRIEAYDIDGNGLVASEWVLVGDDTPVAEAALVSFGDTPCAASGAFVKSGQEDRLLVTRFVVE